MIDSAFLRALIGEEGGPLMAIRNFLDAGGPVLLLIGLAGVMLWTLVLERWWFFRFVQPRMLRDTEARWQARANKRSWAARRVRGVMISDAHLRMSGTLPLIRTLIAACPMLGLLGTVTGMIAVFDVMALVGTGDAQAMAAGVSRATVPTMAGMIVGISGLLPLNRFEARVRASTERLADHLSYESQTGTRTAARAS
jgi:biopolymer transport protein ExbB